MKRICTVCTKYVSTALCIMGEVGMPSFHGEKSCLRSHLQQVFRLLAGLLQSMPQQVSFCPGLAQQPPRCRQLRLSLAESCVDPLLRSRKGGCCNIRYVIGVEKYLHKFAALFMVQRQTAKRSKFPKPFQRCVPTRPLETKRGFHLCHEP